MKKLFRDLTTEENIRNFGKLIAGFIVVACLVIVVKILEDPSVITLPNFN